MKINGIQAKRKKKFKATTNSKHNLPVAENLLNREFKVCIPLMSAVKSGKVAAPESGKSRQLAMGKCSCDAGIN